MEGSCPGHQTSRPMEGLYGNTIISTRRGACISSSTASELVLSFLTACMYVYAGVFACLFVCLKVCLYIGRFVCLSD